jgi:hypothetical protein
LNCKIYSNDVESDLLNVKAMEVQYERKMIVLYCGRKYSLQSRDLSGRAKENNEKSQLGQPVSRPKCGPVSRSAANDLHYPVAGFFDSLQGQSFGHGVRIGSGIYLGKWLDNEADHSSPCILYSRVLTVYRLEWL